MEPSEDDFNCNKCCSDLEYNSVLRGLTERSHLTYSPQLLKTQNIYLTYSQLVEKNNAYRKTVQSLKVLNLNKDKKFHRLGQSLSYHQRFMVLMSENNVPRIQQLVAVALKNRRSITYIIEKVSQAIEGVYLARPSEHDKDLAYLILKMGGPALLGICHRANKLPSASTAYKVAKSMKRLKTDVTMTIAECFDANIDINSVGNAHAVSLKADETAITSRLRYDCKTDSIQGLCYQHTRTEHTRFSTFEEGQAIENVVKEGDVHIPSDLLVVGLNDMTDSAALQVVLAWPSCEKNDLEGTIKIYGGISQLFHEKTGNKLMNFASDGDGNRRIAFTELTKYEVDKSTLLGELVHKMDFLDLNVGKYEETVSYDPKHLAKRLWTNVISGNIDIKGTNVMKKDILELLSLNELSLQPGNVFKLENLVYPPDKQNVPAATTFCIMFRDIVQSEKQLPYRLTPIKSVLQAFSYVMDGVLSFYAFPDISVSDQIQRFSMASFMLLCLKREHPHIVPNVLYHDIQATFQDALFCCCKIKILCPEKPFYSIRNGTDGLERYFGDLRLLNKNTSIDYLEFVHASSSVKGIGYMTTEKHPDWAPTKDGRTQTRLCLDHSSVNVWDAEKLKLESVDILSLFNVGQYEAIAKLTLLGFSVERDLLKQSQITLRKPRGFLIGVHEANVNIDEILAVPSLTDENLDIEETEPDGSLSLADFIHGNTVEINGKEVYKATFVRFIACGEAISKDRLRRVEGLTRDTGARAPTDYIDNMIYPGDPILVNPSSGNPYIGNIKSLKNANKRETEICSALLGQESSVVLEICKINLVPNPNNLNDLYWDGNVSGSPESVNGKNVLALKPQIDLTPPNGLTKYYFDRQFILDVGVQMPNDPDDEDVTLLLRDCFHCSKRIPLEDMREHVAYHILSYHLQGPNICGYCGKASCCTTLRKTRYVKRTNKTFYKPQSNCQYFFFKANTPKDLTKRNRCTNHVLMCPVDNCKLGVWKYNLETHYREVHPGIEVPADFQTTENEKNKIILA